MPDYLQKADYKVKSSFCDLQIESLQNAGMELHQRLKLARERHFKTAKEAALSIGVPYGTYNLHETGVRGFRADKAELYARRFRVPTEWLSFGIGEMDSQLLCQLPIVGRIGAGAKIDVDIEQGQAEPDMIEVGLQLPSGMIAFEVLGESMYPKYEDGDLIVVDEAGMQVDQIDDGVEAAVRTSDGARCLKKIFRADQDGVFNLESHNAPLIRGVRLEWASRVNLVIPKHNWRAAAPRPQTPQSGKARGAKR